MTTRVLAIDDSLTIRELMNFVLSKAGYEVILAEDGVDGLEKLSTTKPDIIITDINMPRLDGFGVIERARSADEFKGTPILVLTTESDPEKKVKARQAGASGWIVKPFNPNQLLDAIKRVTPFNA